MRPPDPQPDPEPGQRWIGGTNGGHPFGQAEILTVTKTRVRVRFLSKKNRGTIRWMYRHLFVTQFQPMVT